MRTCNRLSLVLSLIFISLFPDLQAQKVEVKPEVTGLLGQEVVLKCQFNPGSQNSTIDQIQWDIQSLNGNSTILVFHRRYGMSIKESLLKERVNLTEQSLKIRDVKMIDAGLYTCSISTFPSGSLKATTKLFVLGERASEQMQMSAGILAAIVASAMLLLGILTAVVYLTYIRRHNAAHSLQVHIDTSTHVASVTRPSYIFRDQEEVYADLRHERNRNKASSLNKHRRTAARAEDVTYAEVKVYHQRPSLETVFSV
ncbi:hypothetical protein XENORESO_005980 [Xenotaenia resolanae]|uniref:Ig-like domain-containing protein n=1 Tax=Xenotaenia resolanae TaxID=208358 RepID=A0ABV0WR28_9TELE